MVQRRWVTGTLLLLAITLGSAQEGRVPTVVNGNQHRTLFLGKGRAFVINGNNNRIIISGHAKSIVVNGNRNVVSVTQVTSITFTGNENRLRWAKTISGRTPQISNAGRKNKVVKGF